MAFHSLQSTTDNLLLSFHWPVTVEIPTPLKTASIEDFQHALTLACKLLEQVRSESDSAEVQEVRNQEARRYEERLQSSMKQNQSEQEALKQSHRTQKQFLEDQAKQQISTLQNQIHQLSSSLTVSKSQLETLRTTSTTFFQDALQASKKETDLQHSKELERIQAYHKESMGLIHAQSKETLSRMEQHYKAEQERLSIEWDRLDQEKKEFGKKTSQSSVVKGQVGESSFDDLAALYTSWGALQNTAKIAHATDRSATIRDCKVLFELKNYSTDVPHSEVVKFHRDMEEHPDVAFGVFLSMNTAIRNKKSGGFITIEWTKRSQMMLYIQHFSQHEPKDIFTFIDVCVDIAHDLYRSKLESEQGDTLHFQKRIDQAQLYIETELKRMSDLSRQMVVDKKNLLEMIHNQHANYKYSIDQSKASLQSILAILLHREESLPPAIESSVVPCAEPVRSDGDCALVKSDGVKTEKKKRAPRVKNGPVISL